MNPFPRLIFRGVDPEVVFAWSRIFIDLPDCSVGVGDITLERADAIISPANSFGFMDGGVDLAYLNRFGLGLQRTVQDAIGRIGGELAVGSALIVPTKDRKIPLLVVAPTMRTPHSIQGTQNVERAMSAALRAILSHGRALNRVLVPGMGTGVGQMDPFESAQQLRDAIDRARLKETS